MKTQKPPGNAAAGALPCAEIEKGRGSVLVFCEGVSSTVYTTLVIFISMTFSFLACQSGGSSPPPSSCAWLVSAISMLLALMSGALAWRHGVAHMCAPELGKSDVGNKVDVSPAFEQLKRLEAAQRAVAERAEKQAALAKALKAKADRKAASASGLELSAPDEKVLAQLQIKATGRLGEGHFGTVLLGEREGDGTLVAIKVARELEREARVLRLMSGAIGFPALLHHHKVVRHWRDAVTGANAGANELLVVERLGPSLQKLWEADASAGLPAATVKRLGRGALRCLRLLHGAGVVHNDVKPANVCVPLGGSEAGQVHLIDFGISTRLEDSASDVCVQEHAADADADADAAAEVDDYCHLPVETSGYVEYLRLQTQAGTPAYASLRQQRADEPHTRAVDDLESLAYSLAFVGAGSLPWQVSS